MDRTGTLRPRPQGDVTRSRRKVNVGRGGPAAQSGDQLAVFSSVSSRNAVPAIQRPCASAAFLPQAFKTASAYPAAGRRSVAEVEHGGPVNARIAARATAAKNVSGLPDNPVAIALGGVDPRDRPVLVMAFPDRLPPPPKRESNRGSRTSFSGDEDQLGPPLPCVRRRPPVVSPMGPRSGGRRKRAGTSGPFVDGPKLPGPAREGDRNRCVA